MVKKYLTFMVDVLKYTHLLEGRLSISQMARKTVQDGKQEVKTVLASKQAWWIEEEGQAMLEYVLVLSVVVLPLVLVARHMQHEMATFLRHLLWTVPLWLTGA